MGILISALAGAVCVVISFVVVLLLGTVSGAVSERRSAATVLLALVLWLAARQSIVPDLYSSYQVSRIEPELLSIPAYAAMKQYAPDSYNKILADLKTGIGKGTPKAELVNKVSAEVSSLALKSLKKAGDREAVAYLRTTVQEMKELRAKGGGLCHQFLFPPAGTHFDATPYITQDTKNADLQGLADLIKSASTAPQPVPTQAEVQDNLVAVMQTVAFKFGDQVIPVIQNPSAPGWDKEQVCDVMIGVYDQIFTLPDHESGKLVRFMMASI